jgi:phosphoribosylcarboxyaminoimidazole (NCAIR) mutase
VNEATSRTFLARVASRGVGTVVPGACRSTHRKGVFAALGGIPFVDVPLIGEV